MLLGGPRRDSEWINDSSIMYFSDRGMVHKSNITLLTLLHPEEVVASPNQGDPPFLALVLACAVKAVQKLRGPNQSTRRWKSSFSILRVAWTSCLKCKFCRFNYQQLHAGGDMRLRMVLNQVAITVTHTQDWGCIGYTPWSIIVWQIAVYSQESKVQSQIVFYHCVCVQNIMHTTCFPATLANQFDWSNAWLLSNHPDHPSLVDLHPLVKPLKHIFRIAMPIRRPWDSRPKYEVNTEPSGGE